MLCYFFVPQKAKVKVWIKKIIQRKAPQSHSETFSVVVGLFCIFVVIVVECDGISVTLQHPIKKISHHVWKMAHGEKIQRRRNK